MRYFIRFGRWRENEISSVVYRSIHIKDEIGVSVYDAAYIDGKYMICMPFPHTVSTMSTMENKLVSRPKEDPVFLVTGDVVGTGTEGEPLIRNVKIIKDITDQFEYVRGEEFEDKCDAQLDELRRLYNEAYARGERFLY